MSNDDLRKATVESIMSSGEKQRERWIIEKLLDISETCASRNQCGLTTVQQWTPAAVATALSGGIIGIVEWFRTR